MEKIKGRIWILIDEKGKLINDIDTDQIYHNAYLHITDINEMGKYALGNLKGWEDFSKKAKKGDIILAGKNFGAGSSRQQAVDCFISLGISLIIAQSFGAIYKRNAINSGLAILTFPELDEKLSCFENGDKVEVDLLTGEIENLTKKMKFQANPVSKVQYEIYKAGNLFKYAKK
ncbi:3-isopropylmalate dehydratase [Candidatus Aminicenantes bacterium AC-335-A11]|jgi:3-isopropylmalate/(R)-2-methylmalate dehydratase small subunit|nr:3-isopropylmalate dehydratase [SCandidatus Aminicenantes bacterium Aminicenantia_JdfR_composite]MCP2618598.1 3-isopropylmalate dehydratase [Candidatus Aminicenantes bacterium AC-335-A11]MCP2621062.1 3-isopropylmalate dehydratase [Candidatus Aminicenantes bacterium AC-334-E05]